MIQIFLVLILCAKAAFASSIIIDANNGSSLLIDRFWTSTGLCPTPSEGVIKDFLLSKDEELNLSYIGSLPNRGITHVRIHWLLDLIQASCRTENWEYNFQDLDIVVGRLYDLDLSLGFELMGNPSACFSNMTNDAENWRRLVRQIVERYTDKFGENYVKRWRFESLNEPDLKMFNKLNMNFEDFKNYIITSAAVLAQYNMTLWGPAGLFKDKTRHPLCWGLLHYCQQQKTCPVGFLTFHKKGDGVASLVVKRGEEVIENIREEYPELADMPFGNEEDREEEDKYHIKGHHLPISEVHLLCEADPLTGWIHSLHWRADVRYAAAVIQTVIGTIGSSIRRSYKLAVISNDNGFLSYYPNMWTQRTLLARFQMNNTFPTHTQMFRKPVYAAMEMMSFLGNRILSYHYNPVQPGLSYLATVEEGRITILLVLNNDTLSNSTWTDQKSVQVKLGLVLPLNPTFYKGMRLLIDNKVTNPEQMWRETGEMKFPSASIRRKIRDCEGPQQHAFDVTDQTILYLSVPSVVLINICPKNVKTPGRVTGLRFTTVTKNEVLLMWSDNHVQSSCLQTFIVEFKKNASKIFKRITRKPIQSNILHFDGCIMKHGQCKEVGTKGYYRVSALDMWGKQGPYSNVLVIK